MIDPIAKLHSPIGALLSLYVNRRPPATRAAIAELARSLETPAGGRNVGKSFRVDRGRIIDLASRIDAEQVPAVAVFASHADGIFEYLPLTHAVQPAVAIGPRPYMRPLRSRPRPYRAGVMVGDTTRAHTYLSAGGGFHEIGGALTIDPGKENYGGFGGYEEQRIRSRADDMSVKLWRQAGRRLLEAHQDQPLDLVVVGGHPETLDGMASQLHAYLRELPNGRIAVDPRSLAQADLAALVGSEVERDRTRHAYLILDRLLSEVARGGDAVTGLASVLAACNAHAVDHLMVAGGYARSGVLCDYCGWLARAGSECPLCAHPVFAVEDVVSAAMDATVESGGRVEVVDVASRMDTDGVGALLRFSVAV